MMDRRVPHVPPMSETEEDLLPTPQPMVWGLSSFLIWNLIEYVRRLLP